MSGELDSSSFQNNEVSLRRHLIPAAGSFVGITGVATDIKVQAIGTKAHAIEINGIIIGTTGLTIGLKRTAFRVNGVVFGLKLRASDGTIRPLKSTH